MFLLEAFDLELSYFACLLIVDVLKRKMKEQQMEHPESKVDSCW